MEKVEEYPEFFIESSVFGFFIEEDSQDEELETTESAIACTE